MSLEQLIIRVMIGAAAGLLANAVVGGIKSGLWGAIIVGILGGLLGGWLLPKLGFHLGSGLIEGNVRQFGVQALAVGIAIVYAFFVTWLILKVQGFFGSVRVSEKVELAGLDAQMHGETAHVE